MMANLMMYLPYANLLVSIFVFIAIVSLYRCTRRTSNLIMLPSMIYFAVYYGVYLYSYKLPGFSASAFQLPSRIGISLILVCILIKILVDIYASCHAKR